MGRFRASIDLELPWSGQSQGYLGVMERTELNKGNPRSGFSLVELLVAMAITGVVMAAVFKIYTTQQDSYVLQEQVAEMQQNGRTAKYVMTREIRMVGYDPTGLAGAGFISAGANLIHFTMDMNENEDTTDPGDNITYSVSADKELMRNDGFNNQPVVENVEAVGFAYAYDEDNDGDVETCGSEIKWAIDSDGDDFLDLDLDTNGDCKIDIADDADSDGLFIDGTAIAPSVSVENIRAVKIWLLVKTGHADRNHTSADTFVVGNRIITTGDGNRRQLLATTVKCRNMAL